MKTNWHTPPPSSPMVVRVQVPVTVDPTMGVSPSNSNKLTCSVMKTVPGSSGVPASPAVVSGAKNAVGPGMANVSLKAII